MSVDERVRLYRRTPEGVAEYFTKLILDEYIQKQRVREAIDFTISLAIERDKHLAPQFRTIRSFFMNHVGLESERRMIEEIYVLKSKHDYEIKNLVDSLVKINLERVKQQNEIRVLQKKVNYLMQFAPMEDV